MTPAEDAARTLAALGYIAPEQVPGASEVIAQALRLALAPIAGPRKEVDAIRNL